MNINELIKYFDSVELPESLQLDPCTFIKDVRFLVNSNISYVKAHPSKRAYKPYYIQLMQLKTYLDASNDKE